ncbi:DUF1638 domain-containing protein [Oceanibacterium hippocampi]|uniref:DUF1638 domain-containing protein n=1 Tax=Oceanibacterium hippocampi TaxID=745714 RepID=A0A1Y5U4P9_9PROT|nr:DUF1638 domain-containing protein [Oceanibacterium hippocampi]SLN77187.1 hypothetical protein OCH7691_04324 [Oceanibacterium hippocampi]
MQGNDKTLLIACGALAREILAIDAAGGWDRFELQCLPAKLHNRPALIPEAVRGVIRANRDRFARILVVYGDCGTGGLLDRVLEEEGVSRIGGDHCYEFYTGSTDFAALMEAEPGTFFLTDYLTRQFDSLVWTGLGLDRHPELLPDYFGNYSRLVYLAQRDDPTLVRKAEEAAARLGLAFELRRTGYGELADFMAAASVDRVS